MTTDTSERGLKRLICTVLTGSPCDPGAGPTGEVRERPAEYGVGWIGGRPEDYATTVLGSAAVGSSREGTRKSTRKLRFRSGLSYKSLEVKPVVSTWLPSKWFRSS